MKYAFFIHFIFLLKRKIELREPFIGILASIFVLLFQKWQKINLMMISLKYISVSDHFIFFSESISQNST